MINPLYTWSLKHGDTFWPTSLKTRTARGLLWTVFRTRYSLHRAELRIVFMDREAKRYRKKLDNLYSIIAEYEAFGDATTGEMDDSRIDAVLAREVVEYGN